MIGITRLASLVRNPDAPYQYFQECTQYFQYSASLASYLFCSTCFINLLKHEHSYKIL